MGENALMKRAEYIIIVMTLENKFAGLFMGENEDGCKRALVESMQTINPGDYIVYYCKPEKTERWSSVRDGESYG